MGWKDKLTDGEQKVVQEIVDQVPTTMGFRDIFEGLLDKLANGGGKYRFIVVDDGDVTGTNDEAKARELGQNEDLYVIDALQNKWLQPFEHDNDDPDDNEEPGENDSDITECRL